MARDESDCEQGGPSRASTLTAEALAAAAAHVELHGWAEISGSEIDAYAVASAIRRFAPPQPERRPWGIDVKVGYGDGLILVSRIPLDDWDAVAAALRAWRPAENQ